MTLDGQTKYGLTFGQILSLLMVLGGIVTVWISLNIRVANAEIRITYLEITRIEHENRAIIRDTRNREDHDKIMNKLDRVIDKGFPIIP